MPDQRYAQYLKGCDFIQRYIFPGSCVPSLGAMTDAVRKNTDLKVIDLEDIAPHYAKTLSLWRERFNARVADILTLGYPERFIRLWNYYFAYCEAGFAAVLVGLSDRAFAPSVARKHFPRIVLWRTSAREKIERR